MKIISPTTMKFFELKFENLEQISFSTSIETVGPFSYSKNNLQKSNNLLMKQRYARRISLGQQRFFEVRSSNLVSLVPI